MRQAGILFVTCSIAFVAILIFVFTPPEQADQNVPIAEPKAPVFEERKTVRDVTPESLVQAPEVTETVLERLPAAEPPPPPPRPVKPDTWVRPIVVAAGVIKSGEKTITLADIEPLKLDAACTADDGTRWPCGMLARTEMRLFVRGRPLECAPKEDSGAKEINTRCTLDGFDASAWLVLTGWAKPIADSFQEELDQAKSKQRGMWRKSAP